MRAAVEEAIRKLRANEPCVLVTVVRTKGSTPQKPGAKLLVRADGTAVGTLGGGCVEGDIWFAAKEILRKGSGPEYRDYYLNEDIAARDGLVCGGTMYFFLDPLCDREAFLPFADALAAAYDGAEPATLATVVATPEGRANSGAKLLVRRNGAALGTLGTPELDAAARTTARRVADLGKNEFVEAADGTSLFIEGFTTPPTLVLMGGGHIAKATAPIAKALGFRTYVIDDRPAFANDERFPEAEATVIADFAEGLSQVPVNANTFIVVATRGHRSDDLALEAAARTPARYVGLVGSKRKTVMIYRELLRHGIPVERVRDIHAPIGLAIGALTPEEIAVSIMSEITMVRHGGEGGPMKLDDRLIDKAVEQAEAATSGDAG